LEVVLSGGSAGREISLKVDCDGVTSWTWVQDSLHHEPKAVLKTQNSKKKKKCGTRGGGFNKPPNSVDLGRTDFRASRGGKRKGTGNKTGRYNIPPSDHPQKKVDVGKKELINASNQSNLIGRPGVRQEIRSQEKNWGKKGKGNSIKKPLWGGNELGPVAQGVHTVSKTIIGQSGGSKKKVKSLEPKGPTPHQPRQGKKLWEIPITKKKR